MNSICIDNNMINILSKLKGNKFISYECDLEENWNRTYGFVRINTDNKAIEISVQQKESSKKGKYADVMNVRLSNGRRDEIKRFCTNCGVTVTQYIESSFEFLAKEVAAGHIVISRGGISKVE